VFWLRKNLVWKDPLTKRIVYNLTPGLYRHTIVSFMSEVFCDLAEVFDC